MRSRLASVAWTDSAAACARERLDIGGCRSGAVSAAMNTSGQVGAILSPILVAAVVRTFSNWSAPLYLAGVLFLLGALCWVWVDPTRPVSD